MADYKYRGIEQEPALKGDGYILTVEYVPGKIARLLGFKESERKYYGNGLAWHDMSSWKRCSKSLERRIKDIFIENRNLAQRQTQ